MTQQPMTTAIQPPPGAWDAMFRAAPELIRTASSGPLHGVPPTASFWQALLRAQVALKEVRRTKETDEKAKIRWKYSNTDDWLAQAREALHPQGLLVTQSARIEVGPPPQIPGVPPNVVLRIVFEVVHAPDATGRWFEIDWPCWGDTRGQGPDMYQRAALTLSWKYFLRGLLMVPQTDGEADEIERNDPHEKEGAYRQNLGVVPVAGAQPRLPMQGYPPQQQQGYQPQQQQGYQPQQQMQGYQQQGYQQQPAAQWSPPVAEFGPQWAGRPIVQGQVGQAWQAPPGQLGAPHPQTGYQQPPFGSPAPPGGWAGPPMAPNGPGWQQPIGQEPIVRAAQQMLQAAPADFPTDPNPAPPARATPADGGPDPAPPELLALGWDEGFVGRVCSMRPDEVCPDQLREQFLNFVNKRFGAAPEQGMAAWAGTGFTPGVDPATGQKLRPKIVQIRRYMKNVNWAARPANA